MLARVLVLAMVAFTAMPVAAETVTGTVVNVYDGDTPTVRTGSGEELRIRMRGIDAPEKDQPWGQKSREALARQIDRKRVRVELTGETSYDRVIGTIYLQDGTDINHWMVDRGHAWEYERYNDRLKLKAAEKMAMMAGRGIWSQPNPIPPWAWRQGVRQGDKSRERETGTFADILQAVAEFLGLTPKNVGQAIKGAAGWIADATESLHQVLAGKEEPKAPEK